MLKAKITAIAAGSALVLNFLAPAAFADTTVDVSGNGTNSDNTVKVTNVDKNEVTQTNSTVVGININSKANTGGNKANGNTGDGGVTVDTGKAVSSVGVMVAGSTNELTAPDCGCAPANDTVTVSGNGKDSNNKATVKNKNKNKKTQTNGTVVGATITSKAKTGKNKANNNTGSGDVEVKTDDSTSEVTVEVEAPSNTVTP
jgi:hypothetical protein